VNCPPGTTFSFCSPRVTPPKLTLLVEPSTADWFLISKLGRPALATLVGRIAVAFAGPGFLFLVPCLVPSFSFFHSRPIIEGELDSFSVQDAEIVSRRLLRSFPKPTGPCGFKAPQNPPLPCSVLLPSPSRSPLFLLLFFSVDLLAPLPF